MAHTLYIHTYIHHAVGFLYNLSLIPFVTNVVIAVHNRVRTRMRFAKAEDIYFVVPCALFLYRLFEVTLLSSHLPRYSAVG
jgi:hypothetical protein